MLPHGIWVTARVHPCLGEVAEHWIPQIVLLPTAAVPGQAQPIGPAAGPDEEVPELLSPTCMLWATCWLQY